MSGDCPSGCGWVNPWSDSGDRGMARANHLRNDCPEPILPSPYCAARVIDDLGRGVECEYPSHSGPWHSGRLPVEPGQYRGVVVTWKEES